MRFYWIVHQGNQQQFNVYGAPGTQNFADNFTKHHSVTYHQCMQPKYLQGNKAVTDIIGPYYDHCKGELNTIVPNLYGYHCLVSSSHRLAQMAVTHRNCIWQCWMQSWGAWSM